MLEFPAVLTVQRIVRHYLPNYFRGHNFVNGAIKLAMSFWSQLEFLRIYDLGGVIEVKYESAHHRSRQFDGLKPAVNKLVIKFLSAMIEVGGLSVIQLFQPFRRKIPENPVASVGT